MGDPPQKELSVRAARRIQDATGRDGQRSIGSFVCDGN